MVYRIRVILDAKEDIFRDIEVKKKQTLWNLHLGIKRAFSLQEDTLSIFNLLENDGTIIKSIPLEDMSDDGEIMSDIYIDEAFKNIGNKAQFQYGLIDLWEFFCELIEVMEETKGVNYPITVYRFGNTFLKAPGKNENSGGSNNKSAVLLVDDEFSFDEDFVAGGSFVNEDDSFSEDAEKGYDDIL